MPSEQVRVGSRQHLSAEQNQADNDVGDDART